MAESRAGGGEVMAVVSRCLVIYTHNTQRLYTQDSGYNDFLGVGEEEKETVIVAAKLQT